MKITSLPCRQLNQGRKTVFRVQLKVADSRTRHAAYAGGARDTIAQEFDQPVVWTDTLAGQFYLDGAKDKVALGSVTGDLLTLQLKAASTAAKITGLKEIAWNQDTLLNGANGLATLTFCEVPFQSGESSR